MLNVGPESGIGWIGSSSMSRDTSSKWFEEDFVCLKNCDRSYSSRWAIPS